METSFDRLLARLALLGLMALGPAAARAQADGAIPSSDRVQFGIGLLPGFGAEVAYVRPLGAVTLEGVSLLHYAPSFDEGQGSFLLSLGAGGSLRVLSILDEFSEVDFSAYEADFGFRLGPSFEFFFGEETRQRMNFDLFFEPFIRGTTRFRTGQTVFAEIGTERPFLRAGVWFRL